MVSSKLKDRPPRRESATPRPPSPALDTRDKLTRREKYRTRSIIFLVT
jgi:hypothetical protein